MENNRGGFRECEGGEWKEGIKQREGGREWEGRGNKKKKKEGIGMNCEI